MNKLDIVSLVNNNPLTRLNNEDYGPLIDKIKVHFSTEEQLFVGNFYTFLNYDSENDFVIDLNNIWKWLGYSRIDACKVVLVKHFVINKDYKIETLLGQKNEKSDPEISGSGKKNVKNLGGAGINKEHIFLTVDCFKKICLKSKTKKADEIHEYYIKLEKIMNETISEQSERLRNQLTIKDQQHHNQIQSINKDRENILVLNFKDKHVVYLIKIDETTIKFGYTKDIKQRLEQHRTLFGNIVLHAVYETIYNREFELMIKQDLAKHIVQKEYKDKNQTELIQLSESFTLKHLEQHIEKIKQTLTGDLVANLTKEAQELKLKIANYELKQQEINIKQQEINISEQMRELRKQEVKHIIDNIPRTPRKDQYVYQAYNPQNLKLIKTYNTIEEVTLERTLFKDAISQSIGRAIKLNRVYKNHRFWRIEQTDEKIEYEIPPTEEVDRSPKLEQIVKMNPEATEILGVYSCTEEAANKNAKIGASEEEIRKLKKSITNNLSEDGLSYGFHWYRISEVPNEDVLQTYLENNTLPDVQINKNNKKVCKYDKNDVLITTYNSLTAASKENEMSDTTLRKYITNKTVINGFYYK